MSKYAKNPSLVPFQFFLIKKNSSLTHHRISPLKVRYLKFFFAIIFFCYYYYEFFRIKTVLCHLGFEAWIREENWSQACFVCYEKYFVIYQMRYKLLVNGTKVGLSTRKIPLLEYPHYEVWGWNLRYYGAQATPSQNFEKPKTKKYVQVDHVAQNEKWSSEVNIGSEIKIKYDWMEWTKPDICVYRTPLSSRHGMAQTEPKIGCALANRIKKNVFAPNVMEICMFFFEIAKMD